MSPEQESIWLNDQMQHGSCADSGRPSPYVENWTYRLTGPLDPVAVEAALSGIVGRHEALRSSLGLVDGVPSQRVEGALPVRVRQRSVPPAELDAAVRAAVSVPVPLDRPPLLRATLLAAGPQEHVLAVAVHHAVLDGWSLRLLDEEFGELYRAATEQRPPRLAALPVQFGPYALARRGRPRAELDDLVAHWRAVLDGAPAESSFPARRARPAVPSRRGGQVRFRIGAGTVRELRALARTLRVTPFALLAAALSALVGRLSGERDVVIGTPMSRRGDPQLEPLIGCLTDLLPLRSRLDGGFADLARAVRSAVWDAVAHREVSYGRLVRELAGERTLGRFPLFQVVLTVDDADTPGLDLPGVTARRLHPHNGTAKFDAFVHLIPQGGLPEGGLGSDGYLGLLEYASDLFDHADAERLAARFVTLLESALRDPQLPLEKLELLPASERDRLDAYAAGPPGRAEPPLVHEAFRAAAARTPEADAVVHGERRMTYRELDAASDALAARLVARGHGRGARVAFCLPRGPELPVAVLAVLKAGGCCVPVDPAHPAARRTRLLRDSAASALLTSRAPDLGTWADALDVDLLHVEDTPPAPPRPALPSAAPQDLAYVLHTSGSTGRPKGVALPHRALASLVDWQRGHSDCGPGARTLQFAPIGFDVAFQELFATWAAGGTLVLVDDATRRDPRLLLDLVDEQRVDRLFLPFVALQQLAAHAVAAQRPCRVREFITAGEQLHVTPALRAFLTEPAGTGAGARARLVNQYGPTESHVVTAHPLTGDPAHWPELPPVGRPVAGARVRLLDADLRPVPLGAVGEICIGGRTLAAGYVGYPGAAAETRARFVHVDGERLYRSGDLGRYAPDGSIEFVGRRDAQVKIRGHRVEPAEAEAAVRAAGGVTDAVVLATGDPKRLVAHYTGEAAPEQLRAELAAVLPAHLVPTLLVPAAALPLTASGKVDRAALAAATPGPTDDRVPHVPPRSPRELHIAELWQRALGTPGTTPGVHDDFFAVGGDSLRAARLVLDLRTELGLDLPLNAVFGTPTIAGLATHTPARPAHADLAVRLPADIAPTTGPAATSPPRHVLLTGATGFLGAFLLRALLARTDATVHCLIRGTGQRLHDRLRAYGLHDLAADPRIVPHTGDLAAPRLGLAPGAYERLARTVDLVLHCGAEVNLAHGYDRLRAANTDATAEVLRLAAAHRTVPVHHVSTVGVLSGTPASGAYLADDPLPPPTGLRHGYAQSKWAAEHLVGQARRRGLPVTVHRPTRLTGDSATGVCQDADYLWLLLQACARLGLAPDASLDLSFDLVPVDRAAAAIVALALRPAAAGRTFHIAAGRRLTLATAVDRLRTHGHRIADVPPEQWLHALRSTPTGPALLAVLTDAAGRVTSEGAHPVDATTTRALLDGTGIDLAGDGADLFAACVRHFTTTGFLPPP
ncbi:non-ribosomal peptide synthetase [Streptomyces sp. Da 82-17]|uniref:non-ribosomal peptide synthetase n=1 Tax=Streptomyces sp. Da 82-17 TaxID=3377116 RepID=UPI0038D3D120